MDHLQFLNRLMANRLALNPARVLLYIAANPACHQKDMLEPLNMSRTLLSQCCQLLINREIIFQEGNYISKTHNLRTKGEKLITLIKNDNP